MLTFEILYIYFKTLYLFKFQCLVIKNMILIFSINAKNLFYCITYCITFYLLLNPKVIPILYTLLNVFLNNPTIILSIKFRSFITSSNTTSFILSLLFLLNIYILQYSTFFMSVSTCYFLL